MTVHGVPFETVRIPLYRADSKPRLLAYSPAGKVPVLIDGEIRVWESLAILDYLAERFPETRAWPDEVAARAHARSICAEMHAGFQALRSQCGMNVRRRFAAREWPPEVQADVARIRSIWTDCRARFGAGGPFLFGRFGAADAMYAPVVWRLENYAHVVEPPVRAYMDAMLALPAMRDWHAASVAETEVIPQFEPAAP